MATNKKVIVLAPNGRRQNVAVTPNTTILQILEEVCQKHGYDANDYDLKHFNHVLDSSAILRFTGLANNAQVEMVPCTKKRSISTVVIGIQLENGERLMGEYIPDVTLAEILQNVKLNEDFEKVTLIYMHREVSGMEALKKTTLKSLGLNNGRAILRLIHKISQDLQIITSIPSKPVKVDEDSKENKRNSENEYSSITDSSKTPSSTFSKEETQAPTELEICPQNIESKMKEEETEMIVDSGQSSNECETDDLYNIEFLGERNALVFNLAEIQGTTRDELPDDFYDLTVNDAKILLRDAKRCRKVLEEAPLLTSAQRQLDQEKRTLDQLNKYRYTIIRIQFPDQFVLQGLFRPMETVQAIKDFIKCYLIDANNDFTIFTTPPKHILNPAAHLIDENLVPCAIIYYSGPSTLRLDIKEKYVDPKKVELQVARIRAKIHGSHSRSMECA
ncbi:tether containing UBX domain for GLUT4 [Xylocopa sonorina]|uniref:tether containing UBX domain for GLUT4 n=1 Tax=Xylocopa sonorina TaxID=1818115 RepID=UPI00403AC3AD